MTDPQYPEGPPTEVPPTVPVSPWGPPPGGGQVPPPSAATGGAALPPPAGDPAKGGGGGKGPKLLAIAVGVVALGGGTAFAVQSFAGDESGAASPEEAAEGLVSAIADEDILGVVELLPDGERELLRDLSTDVRDEYQRLGVLSDSFSLDGFTGVEITAEDVEFDVEEITEGLALVEVTDGELSIEVDGDELVGNLGDVVESVADERDADIEVDDTEEETDADEVGASFVVIEEDGRWHPSLMFTIAELARQDAGDLDEPDLDDGVDPEGADSPEDALQALLDAASSLDAEEAIAVLDPGEAQALQVYSQFFLPIDDDELPEDLTIEAELTDAEVDDLGGGASRVVPTGIEVRFESPDGTGEFVLDDGCATLDIQPADDDEEAIDEEFCAGEAILPDELADVEVPEELQEVAEAFAPIRSGIITVERDGQHFVSPIRTIGDALLGLTRGLEPEDLEEGGAVFALLAGDLDDEVEDLLDQLFETAEQFEDFEDFEDEDFDEDVDEPADPDDDPLDDVEEDTTFPRTPFGPSGLNGELLAFDAVEGTVATDGTATFTALVETEGDYIVGAQGRAGFDSTVRVVDVASGQVLAENDDFFDRDPEVLLQGLVPGQVLTIEVAGFAGGAGDFIVYFEAF